MGLSACVSGLPVPSPPLLPGLVELEPPDATHLRSPGASGGRAVRGPADVAIPEWQGAPVEADLWLRYALHRVGEEARARLEIWLGDERIGAVELTDTLHADRFEWQRIASREWRGGESKVTLRAVAPEPVALDCIAWTAKGSAPETPLVEARCDGFLVQAADGARLADPEWTLRILRTQRQFLARSFGFDVTGTIFLTVLPAAGWERSDRGAYQKGRMLYLRDDELAYAWHRYPHELFHVFQSMECAPTPLFFTEGAAHCVALEVERQLFDRQALVEEQCQPLRRLLSEGDGRFQPGGADRLGVYEWEPSAEQGPDRERNYLWANAIVVGLHERLGPDWLPRTYALLRDREHPLTAQLIRAPGPAARMQALVPLLSAGAGLDLVPYFERLGWRATRP